MYTRKIAWFWAGILFLIIVVYVLLALAPYYLNGIFLQPEGQITGQALDPSGYPPFKRANEGEVPSSTLLSAAITTAVLLPFITPVVSIGIVVALYSYFDKSYRLERVVLGTVLAVGFLLFCGAITIHWLIPIWLAD